MSSWFSIDTLDSLIKSCVSLEGEEERRGEEEGRNDSFMTSCVSLEKEDDSIDTFICITCGPLDDGNEVATRSQHGQRSKRSSSKRKSSKSRSSSSPNRESDETTEAETDDNTSILSEKKKRKSKTKSIKREQTADETAKLKAELDQARSEMNNLKKSLSQQLEENKELKLAQSPPRVNKSEIQETSPDCNIESNCKYNVEVIKYLGAEAESFFNDIQKESIYNCWSVLRDGLKVYKFDKTEGGTNERYLHVDKEWTKLYWRNKVDPDNVKKTAKRTSIFGKSYSDREFLLRDVTSMNRHESLQHSLVFHCDAKKRSYVFAINNASHFDLLEVALGSVLSYMKQC